nr:ATP-binding cassette domain-containing protein [Tropicibacter naphthalenivorans]
MDGGDLAANFVVPARQKLAVLGPSGAGKSTLLDAIAGFRPMHAGTILCDGAEITQSPPEQRPVSILFQDANLFPHLTVARNLGLALRPDGGRLSPDAAQQVAEALTRVGLSGYDDRKPGTLSGGQQGRAALARVLLQARPVILLDEPFAALGPALKVEMLGLVTEVADRLGATVLMVTHDPEDARRFADGVILVADGQAHPPQPTQEFFDDPPRAFVDYVG